VVGNALLCIPASPLREALTIAFTGLGWTCHHAQPDDDGSWHQAIAEAAPLRAMVHAVPPRAHSTFPAFEADFERVVGSLWRAGTLAAPAMREAGGGAIVVLATAEGSDPVAAMFGDGLKSLAACLGVAFAEGPAPVRVNALAVPLPVLRGQASAALLARAAATAAFLASPDASYITATTVPSGC